MKKIFSILLIFVAIVGLSVAQGKTLQDYYSQPTQKKMLDALMKELDKKDSTMEYSYKVKGNTMIYIYKYTSQIEDVELARNLFDGFFTDALIEAIKDGIRKDSGINDVHVQYIYYNKDGSEIYNRTW